MYRSNRNFSYPGRALSLSSMDRNSPHHNQIQRLFLWLQGDRKLNITEEQKKMLDFAVDAIPGLLCMDTNGTITYVNKQMEFYKGHTAEEMIGKNIKEFFPYTLMMDTLENQIDNRVVLYQGDGITSKDLAESSYHKLIYEDGKIIGLMTYDLFQNVEELEKFISMYIQLNDNIKYTDESLQKFKTTKYSIDDILGISPAVTKVKKEIMKAAARNSTVLITGETGTGKEMVAQSIHSLSKRFMNSFVELDSSAVPESLIESELFGYVKGSFTGASVLGQIGRFEAANRGTLFIDEIESLSMSVQPKLLRVLQEKEIQRIGSNTTIPVDVRIICATNQNLEKLVQEDKFRSDLYYRLDVINIHMPPLRNRKEDIPLLTEDFISKFNAVLETDITGVSAAAMKKLQDYDWPGNVRELKNVIERAMNETNSGVIKEPSITFSRLEPQGQLNILGKDYIHSDNPIEDAKRAAEAEVILDALNACGGNKSKAAKLLKIPRPLLYQKMNRLGI